MGIADPIPFLKKTGITVPGDHMPVAFDWIAEHVTGSGIVITAGIP
ncbi:MAG: hypothetical protein JW944_04415 [Deltaproteobacteria bacterium]|nr:hypothetical protein [Deltaproteobacteria bacterium]